MTTFFIIRHGFSKSNENGLFTGQTDVPLAPLGIQQAEQTARYLYSNCTIDAIYSSPLQRAYATALPIATLFSLPIQIDNSLKEINGGAWERKTPEEITALYTNDYAFWLRDIGLARCTDGESMLEVQTRAYKALQQIAINHDGERIAIVTHAGVIRALQCLWLKCPLSEMKNIPWTENTSISTVRFDGKAFYPDKIGDTKHLKI